MGHISRFLNGTFIRRSWFFSPGDDAEAIALKQRFWKSNLPTPFTLAVFGCFFWFIHVQSIAIAMWLFGGICLSILLLFLYFHKYVKTFVLINLYFYVAFSFAAVLFFGGILNSGGIVLVGLAASIMSLSFLKPRQFKIIFSVYLASVIIEALIQPLLIPRPEITPKINLILFVLHFLVIAAAIFQILSFYLEQSIQIKGAEADRLRELDLLKSRFYTNISHEFRTPLTVIIGMTDQIQNQSSSYHRTGIKLIRNNGLRLLQLVNQMLDLSKLEAGAMPLQLIQSDIISYLRYLKEPFERIADDRTVHLDFYSEMDSLIMDFDPQVVNALFGNLVSNAIKYSAEASVVNIRVCTVDSIQEPGPETFSLFSERKAGKHLALSVRDSGGGIPKDQLSHIFERFYRIEDTISDNNQTQIMHGTGVGLSLVRELINLMQADLHVRSEIGRGTEFVAYLPITNQGPLQEPGSMDMWPAEIDQPPGDQDSHVDKWQEPSENPLLLIIEDNADVIEYERALLGKLYRIEIARDGIEGIDRALSLVPDIILSDIMMPGKDGLDVCRTLKSDVRTSHIPIILLTAKADMESRIAGLEYGADAYITKPFNQKELVARLKNLLESREKLREKYSMMALTTGMIESPANPDEVFMREMKAVLREHLDDEQFNALELSRIMGLSRVQLFRKLKSLTGMSASQCIRTYRLNAAKELITTSRMNISEVGFSVGFRDPAYFSRAFTREFGCTPSAFRSSSEL